MTLPDPTVPSDPSSTPEPQQPVEHPIVPAPAEPVPHAQAPSEAHAAPSLVTDVPGEGLPADATPGAPVPPVPPAPAEVPAGAPLPGAEDAEAVNRELEAALGDDVDAMMNASMETPAADQAAAEEDEAIHADFKRCRITAVRGEDVFVDLMSPLADGRKLQGVVPLTQFERPPRVGSIMEFLIERIAEDEGLIHMNREGAVQQATWQRLERGMIVEARVTGSNKGGLELEMPGQIRAFMPASQVDLGHIDDLEQFVGQRVEARVHEVDRKHKRVIISRREHLQRAKDLAAAKTMQELQVDAIVDGTVTKVLDFGAFVDIGGVDGLLHVTDLSHSRVGKPSDVVKVGDSVQVKVLKIDKAKGRISLGLKQITPDPWESVSFTEGEEVSGRVTRTANFGAFVEIAEGVDGLLPMSEMSWKRIGKAEDVVKLDEIVKVKVIAVDPAKKKLTLSLKQLAGDPWGDTSEFAVGEIVKGKVTSVTDFGAFAELKDGVEGMVHISELANRHVKQVTDVVQVGQEHEFRVIGMDAAKHKIKLSIKQLKELSPEEKARDPEEIKKAARARMKPKGSLKGGMGKGGGLGMGLGDLKL